MDSLQELPVKTIVTKKGKTLQVVPKDYKLERPSGINKGVKKNVGGLAPLEKKTLQVVHKDYKLERPSGINKSVKKNVGGLAPLEKKTPLFEQHPPIRFNQENSISLDQFPIKKKLKKKTARNSTPKNEAPPTTWQTLEPATCQPDLKEIMREQKSIHRQQSKSLTTIDEPTIAKSPEKIAKNQQLIEDLLRSCKFHDISINYVYENKEMNELSEDFNTLKKIFKNTMHSCMLTSIKRVVNPYLLLSYHLKKTTNDSYREELLFHGTKIENVDSICIDNFDWRMMKKHRFGKGVCFSTTPSYAKNYTDQSGNDKVMFAVKTLIGSVSIGQRNDEVPQEPSDTTTNEKGQVYVKYDDSTFYPEYIINYQEKSSI